MTLDFAHVLYQFNYDCDHIGTFENARTQLSLFMVDPIHTRFRKVFIITNPYIKIASTKICSKIISAALAYDGCLGQKCQWVVVYLKLLTKCLYT